MKLFGVVLAMLCCAVVSGADLEPTASPSDAVGWAISDLLTLAEEDRPFQRYVWIPPWADKDWPGALSFAINTAASRSTVVQRPTVVANGYMLRWDLRRLAPAPADLASLIKTWDGLAVSEPYFHVPQLSEDKATTIVAPHIQSDHASLLGELNFTGAMCYRADWLLGKLLTTTEGGKYYEFRGIGKSADKRSDQEFFLAKFGGYEQLSSQLKGDQRVAMFRSRVTAKPRRVDGFRGLAGRAGTGQIWITRDIRDRDVLVDKHPMYNLLDFRDEAREVILESNNGLHVFALFDGKGSLVREVPPDVAKDHTIPAPNTARLQPAMSCIVCHGPDGGLKPSPNDVATLLGGRLDVFDDLSNKKDNRFENLDRLAGLYAGRFERRLRLGRDDYSLATEKSTGGLGVKDVSALVGEIHYGWALEMVTPTRAVLELGWPKMEEEAARQWLAGMRDYPQSDSGIAFEDVAVAALRQGLAIRRSDFDRVYADMILRTTPEKEPNEN